MSREKVSRTICDRCKRVVEEVDSSTSTDDPDANVIVYVELNGTKAIEFVDLCQPCDERVNALVKDIRLERPEGKKGRGRGKGKDKDKDKKDKKDKSDDKKSAVDKKSKAPKETAASTAN